MRTGSSAAPSCTAAKGDFTLHLVARSGRRWSSLATLASERFRNESRCEHDEHSGEEACSGVSHSASLTTLELSPAERGLVFTITREESNSESVSRASTLRLLRVTRSGELGYLLELAASENEGGGGNDETTQTITPAKTVTRGLFDLEVTTTHHEHGFEDENEVKVRRYRFDGHDYQTADR